MGKNGFRPSESRCQNRTSFGGLTSDREVILEVQVGQWAALCAQLVDTGGDQRILFDRRRVVRFEAGINHKRPAAAPVLLMNGCIDAMHIGRRVGSSECDPKKIF